MKNSNPNPILFAFLVGGLLGGLLGPSNALAKTLSAREDAESCDGLNELTVRNNYRVPQPGESFAYDLTIQGLPVGSFEISVGQLRKVEGRELLPLYANAKTSSFVSTVFKSVQGRYMALVDPITLKPFGVRVQSRYGEDPRWERVRFPSDQRVESTYYMKGRKGKRRYRALHELTDLLTLLYLARSYQMTDGMTACQDVFAERRLWRMNARVVGSDRVDTPRGERDTFVVRTQFVRKRHSTLSQKNPPHAELDVYLAKDASQAPLAFNGKLKGVPVRGTLVRWNQHKRSDPMFF